MLIANLWLPFGLYGLVCMFTPIIIALSGRGKMSCARICPRGSFIGKFTKPFSRNVPMPSWTRTKGFKFILWSIMMGTFIILMIWAVPKGIYTLGKTILYFMEAATLIAFLTGLIFRPRSWCTVCPMGFTSGNIRDLVSKKK
ncbi:4Fe-4S binding protein [Clostridium sp. 19966]|nr:4Fe-4S binding protein [Clostridium sp. 19966]